MIHLRAAGTSIVLDTRGTAVPAIVHWGADLGPVDDSALAELSDATIPAVAPSSIDGPLRLSLLPLPSEGWSGSPALEASRDGRQVSPAFSLVSASSPSEESALVTVADTRAGLSVEIALRLDPTGLLEASYALINTGETALDVASMVVTLPVPGRARELLDFSGRWSFERRPQRRSFDHGTISRRTRHGRPGHDSPFLLSAGTAGFGFRSGETWSVHLAWSGDQDVFAESIPTGHSTLGAGELLAAGELAIAPGATYSAPLVLAAWSPRGLDGISERFHGWLRSHRTRALAPRPVIINTWEAVYFDQDPTRLIELAETAAALGVERFVLDDGWMTGRIDDRRALGDWSVDSLRWPDGLHPLVDRVTELGMDFGLWVEPEMVSLDSELAREHPDWILRGEGADGWLPQPWRHQYCLDLANPEAFANILGQLTDLLDEYPIHYLKWDQNRDVLGGSVHAQTIAAWRLMDELRSRYPELEIESCSSGGARIDLGVLARTDRVWVSDTNDPLERQAIQRWTSLLVPPELLGSHLGAPTAHMTGRSSDLGFRMVTALFLSAGIEWDLARATADERLAISAWIALYKSLRRELHSGLTVHVDGADPAIETHGVVSPDRSGAIIGYVCLAAARDAIAAPLVFPGLDPDRLYRIQPVEVGSPARTIQDVPPAWFVNGSATLTGRMIAEVGIAMPALAPQQAILLRLTAL